MLIFYRLFGGTFTIFCIRVFKIISLHEITSIRFITNGFLPQDHTKFVQSVRYSPDGEKYATGGFDGKIFVYNGKDAELIKEMGSPAHKGGVYAVSSTS